MNYLISKSTKEHTVKVERFVTVKKDGELVYDTKTWHLPIAKFDNRDDLTTFLRKERNDWNESEYQKMYSGLSGAMKTLAERS